MSALEQLNIYTLSGNEGLSVENIYSLASSGGHLKSYNLELFLTLCPEFKSLFDSNVKNRYNIMFSMYCNNGRKIFDYNLYEDNSVFCLTWYIAHYLTVALANAKNEGNSANLNSTNLPNNLNYNIGGKELKSSTKDNGMKIDFGRTSYGKNLYEIMKVVGQMNIRGVY